MILIPTTADGLIYPDSSGNTNIWEHIQNLATSTQTKFTALEAFTSWTPIWIDGPTTLGAGGVNNGRYRLAGKYCEAWFRFEIGAGFAWTGTTFEMTLPFVADVSWVSGTSRLAIGSWQLRDDSGPDHYAGTITVHDVAADSADFSGAWSTADGKPNTRVASTAGRPITWAAGDSFSGHLSYRTV